MTQRKAHSHSLLEAEPFAKVPGAKSQADARLSHAGRRTLNLLSLKALLYQLVYLAGNETSTIDHLAITSLARGVGLGFVDIVPLKIHYTITGFETSNELEIYVCVAHS